MKFTTFSAEEPVFGGMHMSTLQGVSPGIYDLTVHSPIMSFIISSANVSK